MIDVTLTWAEFRMAGSMGWDRYIRNRANRRSERYDVENWHTHVTGAWGEYATAVVTDHCWRERGRPDRGDPDVGPLHVRTTSPDNGLRIYPNDPDPEPFVLVLLTNPPTFTIAGWIWAIDARRDEWVAPKKWNRGGHWVPQTALRPLLDDDAWRRPIEDDTWSLRRAV